MRNCLPGRESNIHANVESFRRVLLIDCVPRCVDRLCQRQTFGRSSVEPTRDVPACDEERMTVANWECVPQAENELCLEEDPTPVRPTKRTIRGGCLVQVIGQGRARSAMSPRVLLFGIRGSANGPSGALRASKNDTPGRNAESENR